MKLVINKIVYIPFYNHNHNEFYNKVLWHYIFFSCLLVFPFGNYNHYGFLEFTDY